MEISEGSDPGALLPELGDLSELSLSELADAVEMGNTALEKTLRRAVPTDGSQLLVAASFQSAI
jgi:hypothetical protein